jgi:hypothetical protein
MVVARRAPDPGFTKIDASGGAMGGRLTTAKFASTAGGSAKNAPKLSTHCSKITIH